MAKYQVTPVMLHIDGFASRQVDMVEYTFSQATDKEGQTVGVPRGGKMKITVKAMNNGNCELLNWMCEKALMKNGKIEFMRLDDQNNKMKEIRFVGAYCVEYLEHWEDPGTSSKKLTHYETITITCRNIINQSVMWNNDWL